MKLIIAGGRDIEAYSIVKNLLYDCFHGIKGINELDPTQITEVVSGGAIGVDNAGEVWAKEEFWWDHGHTYKKSLPIKYFLPDWESHGKAAGPMRNKQMAKYADALLLIWDGKSKGSKSMKKEMKKLGKPIFEVIT